MTKPARITLTLDRADAVRLARLLARVSQDVKHEAQAMRGRWDADAAGRQLDQIAARFSEYSEQLYEKLAPKDGK